MPIPTQTKLLELQDVKVFPLISDPEGGTPTYGDGVDIPGILTLAINPQMQSKELNGDNQLLDIWSKVDRVNWSMTNSKVPLNALAVMMGGEVTTSGTTPNQQAKYSLRGTNNTPGYFKLEGRAVYAEEGVADVHVVFHKAKVTTPPNFTISDQSGDFANVSAEGTALPSFGANKDMMDIIFNETAQEIATTADSTAPTVSSTTPADAATGVAVTGTISWVFSEPIKLSTVNTANFMVIRSDTGVAVQGVLSYNAGTNTVTFDPVPDLAATTGYIAVVGTGVEDLAGNHLATPHVINFTTA